MTKLLTSLVFAIAAALAAPAMAASHAGGAPMKASEPMANASSPKKAKSAKKATTPAKKDMKEEKKSSGVIRGRFDRIERAGSTCPFFFASCGVVDVARRVPAAVSGRGPASGPRRAA
jgi:hypothetical protein